MNLQDLKDLLSEAELIMPNLKDGSEARVFQRKVAMTLRSIFPGQSVTPGQIDRLNFEPEMIHPSVDDITEFNWARFFDSKRRLIAILAAKVKHLEEREEKLNPSSGSDSLEIRDLRSNLQIAITEKEQLRKQLEQKGIASEDKEDIIKELSGKIKNARKLRIFLDLTVGGMFLSGAFGFGLILGNVKFDNEKITMSDRLRSNKTCIDSLNKIISIQRDSLKIPKS